MGSYLARGQAGLPSQQQEKDREAEAGECRGLKGVYNGGRQVSEGVETTLQS